MAQNLHRLESSQRADFWNERVDLAAAFRWAARNNWHESIANHFSLAVVPDGSKFLMNPLWRHFSRIRASELLLLDANDPDTMKRPGAPDPTAWAIHGALHRKVPQARCVIHLHPKFGTILASLKDSRLPPIDQNTMRFFERIAIDEEFHGMGLGDEAERLAEAVGDKSVVVMGNHGILVMAPSVAEAFDEFYYLERACETYIGALQTGLELRIASDEVARLTAQQWRDYGEFAKAHFEELKAILDADAPDYRQ